MARKESIRHIFNEIAPEYDRLNHLLSLNIDKWWRKKAIRKIGNPQEIKLLDVACGTADFAIAAVKYGVGQVYGIDISEQMLKIGEKKVAGLGWDDRIFLQPGDSENLVFDTGTFDVVTVGFGVRNFENLEKGLKEMNRVLRTGGKVVILEFSMPECFPVKQLYKFYFHSMLPRIGGWISGNKAAYLYLPDSVSRFPQGNEFLDMLKKCGYDHLSKERLTGGIATIYTGIKQDVKQEIKH